jgi:IMP dehydrogenase/GMP reductase
MSDYDLIHLVPKERSKLRSRSQVDLRSSLYGLYPLISSPMKGISGSALVEEMGYNNCLGILHRFNTIENRIAEINEVGMCHVPFGVAIGFGKNIEDFKDVELRIAEIAVKKGAILIVLDVANGYLPQHEECGKMLRDKFPNIALMSGNIITQEGALYLQNCGFDYVRVGIGHGANCITRKATGVGRNQLAAIKDCSAIDVHLVVDGGIDESGKAVKSFACGAEFAMLGRLLAESFEAEHTGVLYGMASTHNMIENGIEIKSVEGKETIVEKTKPLREILTEFLWNIRSGCTYLDADHYMKLQDKAALVGVDEEW